MGAALGQPRAPPGSVTAKTTGEVHRVFTPFHRQWRATAMDPWPEPGDAELVEPPSEPRLAALLGSGGRDEAADPPGALEEPGERGAHERLASWLESVDDYPETHDLPALLDGTSRLSADLRFGTLSPRHVLQAVGEGSAGREAFCRQLAWRDWYAHLFFTEPSLAHRAMDPDMDRVAWRDDPDALEAWKQGLTGYPFVDAGMRQLAATGWMHNRVRMVTASFLVKDLLLDWREGEAHFRRELVDYELTQNVGNWQWVAGTGPDAAPYFRVFNPVTQSRRFDPDGEYILRWVPELADLPREAVHAPWELGPLELASAGVTLGEDYPEPLVEHSGARERAIAAYEAARSSR
ncbi:MAG: deoxyribodipyrimidine photo-lyase [Microthrixaceae bacterium]